MVFLLQVARLQVTLVSVPNNAGPEITKAGPAMTPKLLMTRPAPQSVAFADALRDVTDQPFDVIISPLLQIVPVEVAGFDPDPDHIIFSSANAVRQADRLGLTRRGIAWCVGDRTAKIAQDAGFQTRSANGTGRDLLDLIRAARPAGSMLHVRGRVTYVDFAAVLGDQCSSLCAYDQVEMPLTDAARAALMGTEVVIVPLFSARTSVILANAAPITAPAWFIGMSVHVADAMRMINCQTNWHIASTPDQKGMLEATQRLFETL
jgi:uroporphyrinogen-III synthase